ncbi:peptidoglycan-recognition protein 2-like [Bacillus rossius redtenbacheri]|uniref:peptidoglycan-recognition protein 2-like n=1 Tax=Bacillus rossius redtenbacheri TaxID=93214 RepID=UPI002FDC93AA
MFIFCTPSTVTLNSYLCTVPCSLAVDVNREEESCPRIISRDGWAARAPLSVEYMIVPVKNVIVQHSFTLKCTSLTLCSQRVSLIQDFYMDERHEDDIAESFLIGGDGNVYEGTGWHRVGNHTEGYNSKAIGISMIGDFRDMLPPARQLEALRHLLRCGVASGELDPDYKLLARRQLSRGEARGVGVALFLELQTWPQWAGQPSLG